MSDIIAAIESLKKLAAGRTGYPAEPRLFLVSAAKAQWLIDNPERAADILCGIGYSLPSDVTADHIRAAFGVESESGVTIDIEDGP